MDFAASNDRFGQWVGKTRRSIGKNARTMHGEVFCVAMGLHP